MPGAYGRAMHGRVLVLLTAAAIGCSSSSSPATAPDSRAGDDGGSAGDDAGSAGDEASASPPTPTWTAFGSRGADSRWGAPLVYVSSQKSFFAFGGEGPSAAEDGAFLLSMASGSWTKIADSNAPAPRYCGCAAYLPDQNQVLVVGGRDDDGPLPAFASTLDLATGAWTPVSGPVTNGVIGCAAAYLPRIGRAVVFGGGSSSFLSETWAYDPAGRAFTKLAPSASPPPRADAVAAYDPGDGGRMLLFAGTQDEVTSAHHLNDLWAFDGTSWTQLHPTGGPPPGRRVAAAGFDAARRRWVVFGGTVESMDYADLWMLDVAAMTWTKLPSDGAPNARGFASAGYDPSTDSYVVVGGLAQPSLTAFSDGYRLTLR